MKVGDIIIKDGKQRKILALYKHGIELTYPDALECETGIVYLYGEVK